MSQHHPTCARGRAGCGWALGAGSSADTRLSRPTRPGALGKALRQRLALQGFPPPSASGAAGSAGMSLPCSTALTGFGVPRDGGNHSPHLSTFIHQCPVQTLQGWEMHRKQRQGGRAGARVMGLSLSPVLGVMGPMPAHKRALFQYTLHSAPAWPGCST